MRKYVIIKGNYILFLTVVCLGIRNRLKELLVKHSIAIIVCYFGRFPSSFLLWKKSCEKNRDFHFHIFTDQMINQSSKNIFIHSFDFDDIQELVKQKLGVTQISLSSPYKLCDFKPMYGLIFQDYIKNYDFWGICDVDMIFGDLSLFITDRILDEYEKVYQLGHLTLYKNTIEVNNRFKLPGYIDWKYVVATPDHCRLCERGMMYKYSLAKIPVYSPFNYADISKIHYRYQLSHWLIPKRNRDHFKHQLFYYENGHIFRVVYTYNDCFVEEFCYIHLQKRKLQIPKHGLGECFYITKNTFISKESGIPSYDEVKKYNPYPGRIYELYECIKYEFKTKNIFNRWAFRLKLKVKKKYD